MFQLFLSRIQTSPCGTKEIAFLDEYQMEDRQVKSKKRVADHGEVFTNAREVKAMVDLVWKNLEKGTAEGILTATFLEPSCGSGNFLIDILQRKIALLKKTKKNKLDFGFYLVLIAGSLYGVELLADNAEECRKRLLREFQKSYPKKEADYERLMRSIAFVISQNIICGDALNYTTPKGEAIVFTHWAGIHDRKIVSNYFDYGELTNKERGMGSLFAEYTLKGPVIQHYLDIGTEAPNDF